MQQTTFTLAYASRNRSEACVRSQAAEESTDPATHQSLLLMVTLRRALNAGQWGLVTLSATGTYSLLLTEPQQLSGCLRINHFMHAGRRG